MAGKKPDLSSIFAKTEPPAEGKRWENVGGANDSASATTGQAAEVRKDRTVSVGLGLKLSEIERLDALAKERNVKRNALLVGIIREWLDSHA